MDASRLDAHQYVLKRVYIMNKMYVSIIVTVSILICLWVYLLLVMRNNFIPYSTSIELNIIDSKNSVFNRKFNQSLNNVGDKDVSEKKRKIHIPKFMLELYEKNKIGGMNKQTPDVVRSLIPTHAVTPNDNEVLFDPTNNNNLLIFNIPTMSQDEHFLNAELKILTLLDIDSNNVGVHRILKISIYGNTLKRLLDFQEIKIHHLNNSWVSFDVTAPVNDILHTNTKSKVLKIAITTSASLPQVDGNFKLSLMPDQEDFEHDYPILLLTYASKKEEIGVSRTGNQRKKRSLEDDYEEDTNKIWDEEIYNRKVEIRRMKKIRNSCKRKPLYVDFAEIKYDQWIVQPSGYDAYQCQGKCFYPVAEHLNPTKHAIIQALLHSVAPSKAPRSCCVPTILDPISVLYVDSNGVLTYRYAYKDMVVAECGCR